jgi:hypothetical protein
VPGDARAGVIGELYDRAVILLARSHGSPALNVPTGRRRG